MTTIEEAKNASVRMVRSLRTKGYVLRDADQLLPTERVRHADSCYSPQQLLMVRDIFLHAFISQDSVSLIAVNVCIEFRLVW